MSKPVPDLVELIGVGMLTRAESVIATARRQGDEFQRRREALARTRDRSRRLRDRAYDAFHDERRPGKA